MIAHGERAARDGLSRLREPAAHASAGVSQRLRHQPLAALAEHVHIGHAFARQATARARAASSREPPTAAQLALPVPIPASRCFKDTFSVERRRACSPLSLFSQRSHRRGEKGVPHREPLQECDRLPRPPWPWSAEGCRPRWAESRTRIAPRQHWRKNVQRGHNTQGSNAPPLPGTPSRLANADTQHLRRHFGLVAHPVLSAMSPPVRATVMV